MHAITLTNTIATHPTTYAQLRAEYLGVVSRVTAAHFRAYLAAMERLAAPPATPADVIGVPPDAAAAAAAGAGGAGGAAAAMAQLGSGVLGAVGGLFGGRPAAPGRDATVRQRRRRLAF